MKHRPKNPSAELTHSASGVYLNPSVLREHTLVLFTLLMKLPIVGRHNEQYLEEGLLNKRVPRLERALGRFVFEY